MAVGELFFLRGGREGSSVSTKSVGSGRLGGRARGWRPVRDAPATARARGGVGARLKRGRGRAGGRVGAARRSPIAPLLRRPGENQPRRRPRSGCLDLHSSNRGLQQAAGRTGREGAHPRRQGGCGGPTGAVSGRPRVRGRPQKRGGPFRPLPVGQRGQVQRACKGWERRGGGVPERKAEGGENEIACESAVDGGGRRFSLFFGPPLPALTARLCLSLFTHHKTTLSLHSIQHFNTPAPVHSAAGCRRRGTGRTRRQRTGSSAPRSVACRGRAPCSGTLRRCRTWRLDGLELWNWRGGEKRKGVWVLDPPPLLVLWNWRGAVLPAPLNAAPPSTHTHQWTRPGRRPRPPLWPPG